NFDDLAAQQFRHAVILTFGVDDDDHILAGQEDMENFQLGGKGFAAAGRTQNQAVAVFAQPPVQDNQMTGDGVDAVVHTAAAVEQFLIDKGHEHGGSFGGQCAPDLQLVGA